MLEQHGLVARRRTLWQRPGVWWTTRRGLSLAEVDLPPYVFNQTLINHTVELVNLYQELAAAGEFLRYRTEREVRQIRSNRPLPDALAMFEAGEWTAVELELTNKRAVRYRETFEAYAASGERGEVEGVRCYFASREGARRASRVASGVDEFQWTRRGYVEFYAYEPEALLLGGPGGPPFGQRITRLGHAGGDF